jgi:hypothetical protein
VGSFWEGKELLKEKNYYREIAEGKSMAKEGLIESLHRERSLT